MNIIGKFFKDKKNVAAQSKKLPQTLVDEIAGIKTVAQMYSFTKKILNPDEVLKKTGKNISVFQKLENEGQIATCIESRNAGVTSLKYHLVFEDGTHQDFYDNLLKNLDISNIIEDILKAPLYGFQPIEIMWGINSEGFVIPTSLTAKPQKWFYYNSENQLCFDKKGCPDGYVITDDLKKFLVPRYKPSYENPYGKSILARCFWDSVFKKGSMEFWMKFAERYGMPFMYGKYQQGMSAEEIDKLLNSLEDMIQDAVAVIPDNSSVEILESGGKSSSAEIYKGIIDICDKNIAKNILGQTLTTETGSSGSYALGNVHLQVRQDIINSDKRLVEKTLNKLFQWIEELNFGTNSQAPTIEFFSETGIDKNIAERDKILTETGIKFTKKYYTKTYNLEDDDFELVKDNNTSEELRTEFSESQPQFKSETIKQDLIDDFTNSFSDASLEKIISPKLNAILSHFAENQDIQTAIDDLSILYPEDNTKTLEETLAKALFLSNIIGASDVKN